MFECGYVWKTDGINGSVLTHRCRRQWLHEQLTQEDALKHLCDCDPSFKQEDLA